MTPRQLSRFVETYRGSSFPTRSELSDGATCVIKMRGAGNGAAVLLSEFVVNRLAHAAGLPVPDAFVVHIPPAFPWKFGTDEFQDIVMKSGGANLGLEWIDGASSIAAAKYDLLPHNLVSQVVTLDLVFANVDRSFSSGNLLQDKSHRCWIVDHGSCRFLFQPGDRRPSTLPRDHAFAGWDDAFDVRWLAAITPALVRGIAAEIPDDWLVETTLTREHIVRSVEVVLGEFRCHGKP
jgi:HipA-like protein